MTPVTQLEQDLLELLDEIIQSWVDEKEVKKGMWLLHGPLDYAVNDAIEYLEKKA